MARLYGTLGALLLATTALGQSAPPKNCEGTLEEQAVGKGVRYTMRYDCQMPIYSPREMPARQRHIQKEGLKYEPGQSVFTQVLVGEKPAYVSFVLLRPDGTRANGCSWGDKAYGSRNLRTCKAYELDQVSWEIELGRNPHAIRGLDELRPRRAR